MYAIRSYYAEEEAGSPFKSGAFGGNVFARVAAAMAPGMAGGGIGS